MYAPFAHPGPRTVIIMFDTLNDEQHVVEVRAWTLVVAYARSSTIRLCTRERRAERVREVG